MSKPDAEKGPNDLRDFFLIVSLMGAIVLGVAWGRPYFDAERHGTRLLATAELAPIYAAFDIKGMGNSYLYCPLDGAYQTRVGSRLSTGTISLDAEDPAPVFSETCATSEPLALLVANPETPSSAVYCVREEGTDEIQLATFDGNKVQFSLGGVLPKHKDQVTTICSDAFEAFEATLRTHATPPRS